MSEPKPDAICVHCGKRYADHVGWYTPTGTVMLCHKSWTIFDPIPRQAAAEAQGKVMSKKIQTVKRQVLITAEVEIAYVSLHVPYDDDDEIPEGTHGADDGILALTVEIATGQIVDWPKDGKAIDIYLKPRDAGTYKLIGPTGELIAEIDEDYVPNGIIPGNYGDYVDLKIDDSGKIKNWPDARRVDLGASWKCRQGMQFVEEDE